MARAQAADPDLRVSGVSFPDKKGRGVLVVGQARAILVRDRGKAVWVDPRDGMVLLALRWGEGEPEPSPDSGRSGRKRLPDRRDLPACHARRSGW